MEQQLASISLTESAEGMWRRQEDHRDGRAVSGEDATAGGGATGRRKKVAGSVHVKLQESRAFFRSLFVGEQYHSVGVRTTTRICSREAWHGSN
uniref:Uncharacterized protein n=1 Tax=Oryza meridionalis TaxID=40149 RepID=A0A0E0CWY7_9ORYZ